MMSLNRFFRIPSMAVLLFLGACRCVYGIEGSTASGGRLAVGLEDAVRIGMKLNREVEIARLDTELSSQKVREAWSEVYPNITSNFTYRRTLEPSVMYLPAGIAGTESGPLEVSSDNSALASINLEQNIFKLSSFAGIRGAALARQVSDEHYRERRADVESSIRKAYYDALIASEKVRLVEQSIGRWETARKDTDAMFRQGVAADIDTLKAFLSVENLKPGLIRARSNVMVASTKLKTVMGLDQNLELALTDSLAYRQDPLPPDLPVAYAEALGKRPDVRALTLQLEAEGEKVTAARSEGLPNLGAFGQFDAQSEFNDGEPLDETTWPTSSSVGLRLSVPIFSGFATSARIEQAKISRMQARTRLDDLKDKVRAEVEIRLWNILEARKRIEVQNRTIAVAERSYRITMLRFREGIGSRLELRDAELQLDTAKINYLEAVYDYLVAAVELDKALGRTAPPPVARG